MEDVVLQRIRSIIKQKRISINALSGMIGMPQVTLNRQMSGESSMTLETFVSIMNKFPEVSLDWVVRGDGKMVNENRVSEEDAREFVVYVDGNGFLKLKNK